MPKGIYTPSDPKQLPRKRSTYRLNNTDFERQRAFTGGVNGKVSLLKDLKGKEKDLIVKKNIDSEKYYKKTKDNKDIKLAETAKVQLKKIIKRYSPAWLKEVAIFNVFYGKAELHDFRIVMPMLGEKTVKDELEKKKDELEILDILIRIFHTYLIVQALGVSLIDIKTSNMLIDDQGNIYPIDFGMVYNFNEFYKIPHLIEKNSGQIAPELKRGVFVNPSLDVHALGDLVERHLDILPTIKSELRTLSIEMMEKNNPSKRMTLEKARDKLVEIRSRTFMKAPELKLTLNPFFAEHAELLKDFKEKPIDTVILSIIEEKSSEKMTRMVSTFVRYFTPLQKWDDIQRLAHRLKEAHPTLSLVPLFDIALQRAAEEDTIPEPFYTVLLTLLEEEKEVGEILNQSLCNLYRLQKRAAIAYVADKRTAKDPHFALDSCLLHAASKSQWEVVESLIINKAKPFRSFPKTGYTALHCAIEAKGGATRDRIIKLLLDAGAKATPALTLALNKSDVKAIDILVKYPIDFNTIPLTSILDCQNQHIIQQLLSHPNFPNDLITIAFLSNLISRKKWDLLNTIEMLPNFSMENFTIDNLLLMINTKEENLEKHKLQWDIILRLLDRITFIPPDIYDAIRENTNPAALKKVQGYADLFESKTTSPSEGTYISPEDAHQYSEHEKKFTGEGHTLTRKNSFLYQNGVWYQRTAEKKGEGTFGIVFGLDPLDDKEKSATKLVVKVDKEIQAGKKNLPTREKYLQKEARYMKHVYGYAEVHNGRVCMEDLGTRTVAAELKANNNELEIYDLFINIVNTYRILHFFGLIQIDLKANNMLINGKGEVCPCDLGQAGTVHESIHFPNLKNGHYAPELKNRTRVSALQDIFSLGYMGTKSFFKRIPTALQTEFSAICTAMRAPDSRNRISLDVAMKRLMALRPLSAPPLQLKLHPRFRAKQKEVVLNQQHSEIDINVSISDSIQNNDWNFVAELANKLLAERPNTQLEPIFVNALQKASEAKEIPQNFKKIFIDLLPQLTTSQDWKIIEKISLLTPFREKIFTATLLPAAKAKQWKLVTAVIENTDIEEYKYSILKLAIQDNETAIIAKILAEEKSFPEMYWNDVLLGLPPASFDNLLNILIQQKKWHIVHELAVIKANEGHLGDTFGSSVPKAAEDNQWKLVRFLLEKKAVSKQTVFEKLFFAEEKDNTRKWSVIESFIQKETMNLHVTTKMLQKSLEQKAGPMIINFLLEKIVIQTLENPADLLLMDALQLLANSFNHRDEKIHVIKHAQLNALVQHYEQHDQHSHVVRLTRLLKEIDPSYTFTDETFEVLHTARQERQQSRLSWLTFGAIIGFVVGFFIPLPGTSALGAIIGAALSPAIGTVIGGYFGKKWQAYKTKLAAKVSNEPSLQEEKSEPVHHKYKVHTEDTSKEYVHFGPLFQKASTSMDEVKDATAPQLGPSHIF